MPDLISNMNERELDLFDAFKAGFWASDEQFNGEYVSGLDRPYGALEAELLGEFTEWRNA